MAEWIYFIHPPRDDFAATMTEEERAAWSVHFARFQRLLAEGTLVRVLGVLECRQRGHGGDHHREDEDRNSTTAHRSTFRF